MNPLPVPTSGAPDQRRDRSRRLRRGSPDGPIPCRPRPCNHRPAVVVYPLIARVIIAAARVGGGAYAAGLAVPWGAAARRRESWWNFSAISEFPKWRKYLILLSFLDNSSARPVQIGGVDVNICHSRSTAVRGRRRSSSQSPPRGGHFVAHGRALWKLTGPWTHRTRPPRLGKRCAFSTSFHRAFPIKSPTKNSERPLNIVGKPG